MWLVAAEALVLPRPKTVVAGLVALLALPIRVHVGGNGTLTVPHTVTRGIQQAALSTGEAGGGQVVFAAQASPGTISALIGGPIIVGPFGALTQTLPPVAHSAGVFTHDAVI